MSVFCYQATARLPTRRPSSRSSWASRASNQPSKNKDVAFNARLRPSAADDLMWPWGRNRSNSSSSSSSSSSVDFERRGGATTSSDVEELRMVLGDGDGDLMGGAWDTHLRRLLRDSRGSIEKAVSMHLSGDYLCFDESDVGKRIRVMYIPAQRRWRSGVIEQFNGGNQKHKIKYDDNFVDRKNNWYDFGIQPGLDYEVSGYVHQGDHSSSTMPPPPAPNEFMRGASEPELPSPTAPPPPPPEIEGILETLKGIEKGTDSIPASPSPTAPPPLPAEIEGMLETFKGTDSLSAPASTSDGNNHRPNITARLISEEVESSQPGDPGTTEAASASAMQVIMLS